MPGTLSRLFKEVPGLKLPTLFSLGLEEILRGRVFDPPTRQCEASYGRMIQRSPGSDALSGLWELAGGIPGCPFSPAAPLANEFIAALERETGLCSLPNPTGDPETLPLELRAAHLQTGHPILTFSADSHLHLAAHTATASAAQLARMCRSVRPLADQWRIARITGQWFTGTPQAWKPACEPFRFPMVPPRTILNAISELGLPVEAVGSVSAAFAHSGITRSRPTATPAETLETIGQLWDSPQNGLIFANLPRLADGTPAAFAQTLEAFDRWLTGLLETVESDNLLLIAGTNDIPADPAEPRQELPILARYGGRTAPLGIRETAADVARTLADFFGVPEKARPHTPGEPLITFHRPR